MNRIVIRWLVFAGLAIAGLGLGLVLSGLARAFAYQPGPSSSPRPADILFVTGLVIAGFGIFLIGIATVGTLVALIRLRRYGWVWMILGSMLLVVVGGLGLLATVVLVLMYSFEDPNAATVATSAGGVQVSCARTTPTQMPWLGIFSAAAALVFPVVVGLRVLALNTELPFQVKLFIETVGSLQIPAILVAIVAGHLAFTRLNPANAHRGLAVTGLALGYLSVASFALIAIAFAGI